MLAFGSCLPWLGLHWDSCSHRKHTLTYTDIHTLMRALGTTCRHMDTRCPHVHTHSLGCLWGVRQPGCPDYYTRTRPPVVDVVALLFLVMIVQQHLVITGAPGRGVLAGPVTFLLGGPALPQAPHPGASLSCWDTGFVRLGHADWYANLACFPLSL